MSHFGDCVEFRGSVKSFRKITVFALKIELKRYCIVIKMALEQATF